MANDRRFIDIAEAIENLETQILACEPADKTEPIINRIVKACVPKLLRNTVDWLKARPVVDAVEVVRCKGCQEYDPGLIRPYLGWCSVWDTAVRETGFCHHGKPRSEEKPKPAWPPQEELEDPCED